MSSFAGINDEFWPLFRITAPRSLREHGLAEVELGKRICRSWVLLLGVLPIDYDDITLIRLDPPNGFLECSRMLSQRSWQHERTLEQLPQGCLLTDSILYQPRLPIPDIALRTVYRRVFGHRHRRLRRRFGGEPVAGSSGAH